MEIRASGRTDTGLVRSNNEDYLVVDAELGLFAVLDGMGGHAAGEVASRTAADTLRLALWDARHIAGTADDDGVDGVQAHVLSDAVRAANRAVWQDGASSPDLAGMGCTATAVLVVGDRAIVGHVGDSRLYLIRNGQATQVSHDHTVVAELVSLGLVAPEDARNHPQAHVLTRVVGTGPEVDVDMEVIELRSGDRLVLCSDGLADYLQDSQSVATNAGVGSADQMAEALMAFALAAGGRDNVTVLVLDVQAGPDQDTAAPHPHRVSWSAQSYSDSYVAA